jgi:hypothetical protein
MKIRMLQSQAGPDVSRETGSVYDVEDAEAIRLVEAGIGVPDDSAPPERAIPRAERAKEKR